MFYFVFLVWRGFVVLCFLEKELKVEWEKRGGDLKGLGGGKLGRHFTYMHKVMTARQIIKNNNKSINNT